jgi:uncharacterized repeat protein (TIGR02543 family)
MKKRILSILLTLCMMLCFTPISVFAEEVGTEGSAAIQLGADALSVLSKNVNTATAPTVYFGQNHENNPAAWRVIGYDGNSAAGTAGNMTLLAANNMGLSKFGASNAYADSALKEAIDALADKLTAKETDAVEKRTLASGNYDGENTDGVAGPAVSNAVFWPLSSKEANAVNNDLRVVDPEHPGWASSYWWLRSPDEDDSTAYVAGRGEVRYYGGYSTSKEFGVRPAFDLNLDSVLFASAAVGGKPDGGLQPVSPNYTGNEWKLTLYDSKRNNFSRTTWEVSASTKGGTVEISYTDAKTGANEYISALIFDDVGNVIYYGRSNASLTEKDGTAQLTIPAGFAEGTYTLEVFNEQYNGDRKTDLASGFADVTLTVEKRVDEQFTLASGGRYYFDLSAMDIPGTVNSNLPDSTLHYVPFTYAGTVDAYVLKPASNHVEDSSEQASVTKDKNAQYGYAYEHSLFIADYRVTTNISWIDLNNAGFIFGKTNTAGGINYTLRAPTMGSIYKSPMRGAPANNEWDQILAKNSDFIKELDNNRNISLFWGQDTSRSYDFNIRKTTRNSVNNFMGTTESSNYGICFRPVLEVLNPDTLSSDGLKAVTLDLGGGKLGNSSDAIQIIVKNGSTFTAPASDGLTRPDGNTDSYFMWLDGNGNSYEPGGSVPADVTELTVQWTAPTYAVTLNTNGGTIADGKDVTGYTYGVGATLPTDVTRTGYTFKGWYDNENLTGSPVTAIGGAETGNKEYWAKWEINQYTITFDTNGGSEIAPITQDYGTEITAPDNPTRKGYTFKGWDKEIPETMPADNITVKAQWGINQYTITFDTNGGSEIASITQDYGTKITAPDNPTRKGYTFKGWDKEIPETMPAENITVKAQWEINQYTITFDTNGGSEIAPITQDYGTKITAPANPTRKGYTFKGWDKEIPKTMPAENITVKAQWEINQYTITFDTNGGSEIAPITQDYGTKITAPDNPTRKGYTFKGWDKEIPETMPAENITVKAQWEINQYTITFDTNGGSEIAPITQDYGTKITVPADPTRKGYTFKGWDKKIPETMPAENITITARWKDTEKPTGEIIIGTNKWNEFLNELTFGIFFKDTQEVTINAVDNSGVVFVSYLVTDKELSEAELNSLVFRAYEEPFCIDPNGEYIIYVMLVDENINITYLRSDRLTLDNIQPVISGIENGKTYCEAQTVTVDEKYVDTVTVNGTAVTLDADGGFVLPPTNGEQKIVVTDKAGNNAEMTVTVNNGHTFGEWGSDNDGKHTRKCTVDGCDAFETENCSGGNATCTEKAVCDVCGNAYGEFDGTNHEGGVQEWTTRTAFNHEQKWNCCGAVIVASEAHEWKDGVCRECGYVCLHNDADKDHICDYCKKTISEHVDKDKNHICDYCEKTISAHEDAPTEEIKKADTVTAKLPDDSKSPQTGDNSNLILWIALLIISGGVMKGVTAFGKNKKHSAKIKDK